MVRHETTDQGNMPGMHSNEPEAVIARLPAPGSTSQGTPE